MYKTFDSQAKVPSCAHSVGSVQMLNRHDFRWRCLFNENGPSRQPRRSNMNGLSVAVIGESGLKVSFEICQRPA